jgi:hypothetical protein
MKKNLTIYIAIFTLSFAMSINAQQSTAPAIGSEFGTLYFSNKPFPAGGSVEGAKTTFNSSEFLYARLVVKGGNVRDVLKPSPPNEKIKSYYLPFEYYALDSKGDKVCCYIGYKFAVLLAETDMNKTYLDFDIFPSPNNAPNNIIEFLNRSFSTEIDTVENSWTNRIYNYLAGPNSNAKEGEYYFGIEIPIVERDFRGNIKSDSKQTIEDNVSFLFNGKDFAAMKANLEKIENSQKNAKINNVPIPKAWTMKSSSILPPLTLAGVTQMYQNFFNEPARIQVLKVFIDPASSQTPTVVNNNLGIPEYRRLNQWFIGFYMTKDKSECGYDEFMVRQKYAGGGTFGNYYIHVDREQKVSCENLGVK